MELGDKIKAARLEAGLSQRQLCADYMTRNMLSQIENGAARPSMDTLRYLAEKLGKTISYFLEDQAVTSPNQETMARARSAFQGQLYADALTALEAYQDPDPVFDQETGLLRAMCLMEAAQQAIREGRLPYAENLLAQAAEAGNTSAYFTDALERQRLLLLAEAAPARLRSIAASLPSDDRELLLRAQADPTRAAAYLDAAQDRESPRWHLLRGEACFSQEDYAQAAAHFHRAEEAYPRQIAPRLEACYRELGDFKKAYEYACKQR